MSATSDVEIVGNGPPRRSSTATAPAPFIVTSVRPLIQGLAIVNGRSINGGGIASAGSLVVVNAQLSAAPPRSAAPSSTPAASLSVVNSTLSGNSATNGGAFSTPAAGP